MARPALDRALPNRNQTKKPNPTTRDAPDLRSISTHLERRERLVETAAEELHRLSLLLPWSGTLFVEMAKRLPQQPL